MHYAEVGDISEGNLWHKNVYSKVANIFKLNYTRNKFAGTGSLKEIQGKVCFLQENCSHF